MSVVIDDDAQKTYKQFYTINEMYFLYIILIETFVGILRGLLIETIVKFMILNFLIHKIP